MKTRFLSTSLALTAFGTLAFAPLMHAQQTAVTTTTASDGTSSTQTTTTAGTIEQFTPGSSQLIVRSSTGAPITYSYSKRTTFVDADGNTVSYDTIKSGVPTTVYYTMEGGQPVVSKVVVRRAVATPVATTTQVQPATVVTPVAPAIQTERTETTTTTTGGK